jgi:hypothetical protein
LPSLAIWIHIFYTEAPEAFIQYDTA